MNYVMLETGEKGTYEEWEDWAHEAGRVNPVESGEAIEESELERYGVLDEIGNVLTAV